MSPVRWILGMALSVAFLPSCAARPKLPPPTYEKSELPAWEAPPPPIDPLDAADLSGDWVEDPEEDDITGSRASEDVPVEPDPPGEGEANVPPEEGNAESRSTEAVGGDVQKEAPPLSPGLGTDR